MKVISPAIWIALIASSISAQEMPQLTELVSTLNGVEVKSSGSLSRMPGGDGPFFSPNEGGYFSTRLAIGRDDLAKVDHCLKQKRNLFDPPPDACQANIKAEIEIRGSNVDLVIFEVDFPNQ